MKSLALLPELSITQFMITYSMQKQRGKAWMISSHKMTSDRQKVWTHGEQRLHDKTSQSPCKIAVQELEDGKCTW